MGKFNHIIHLSLLFLVFAHSNALASVMQVSVPQRVTILKSDNNDSSSLIQVSNPDKYNPRFVRIGVYYIDPKSIGTELEENIEIKDKLKKDNLIVIPDRVVIPPGGRTNVRTIYTGKELNEDKNYRIRFYPITELEYSGNENSEKTKASLLFSIASSSFATVIKSNPSYKLDFDGGKVTNNGDSISLMRNCNICRGNDCKVFTEFRLPPNRRIDFSSLIKGEKKLEWTCELFEPALGTREVKNS